MRDIVLDAITGAALGVVFIAALFLLDIAEIGTLAAQSNQFETLLAMIAIGIIPFFAACAVSFGVMFLTGRQPVEEEPGNDERY